MLLDISYYHLHVSLQLSQTIHIYFSHYSILIRL